MRYLMVGTAWSIIQGEITPGVSTPNSDGRDIEHCFDFKKISLQIEGIPLGCRGRCITDHLPHPDELPIKQVILNYVGSVCHICSASYDELTKSSPGAAALR